jgi:hypothetical protein
VNSSYLMSLCCVVYYIVVFPRESADSRFEPWRPNWFINRWVFGMIAWFLFIQAMLAVGDLITFLIRLLIP